MNGWWQEAFVRAGGALDFGRFVELALYDPEHGYYRRERPRVGRTAGTDFTTATLAGPVFGELLVAAARARVEAAGWRVEEVAWVEWGAEPGRTVLDGVEHPFRAAEAVRVGEDWDPEGPVVVFANELLDAQPFRRFRWREGTWREVWVVLQADGALAEDERPLAELPEALRVAGGGPWGEGHTVDWACGAEAWLEGLARQPWAGVLLLADYGRTWADLVENFPEGTARAYVAHRQEPDLLADPGQRDLTCHVPWDRLEAILDAHGFTDVATRRQEAFLLEHGAPVLDRWLARRPGEGVADHLARVQTAKAILHPAYYGTRFQVLAATRR